MPGICDSQICQSVDIKTYDTLIFKVKHNEVGMNESKYDEARLLSDYLLEKKVKTLWNIEVCYQQFCRQHEGGKECTSHSP